ncbi:MAG: N-acetylglucosamine-6-phosphate deacetylase [Acidimicrobiales bacterium]
MSYVLTAGSVATPEAVLSPGYVAVRGGVITLVGEGRPGDNLPGPAIDLGSRIVAPGYFDVHVHGGDGAQVNGDDVAGVVASVERIARFHARHGTTSMLATTVSDSPDRLRTTVEGVAEVVGGGGVSDGATIRGVHLEGPWIARARMGAQNPDSLRLPDVAELRSLVAASGGCVRMVTVAPELRGSHELIAEAIRAGIRVAVGHTDADYETTLAAIEAGARHATHLFNAMAPPHHRRPGAVTALLLDDRVTLEVVADLQHVHPAALALAARCAPRRLVAVSDAVPAAGLEPGNYEIGRLEVSVQADRVTLASDPATLAGSVLTMDAAVRNLFTVVGMPLDAALAAASATPAAAAGLGDSGLGHLRAGAPADLVVLEPDLSVVATIVAGRAVFDRQSCLSEIAGDIRSGR